MRRALAVVAVVAIAALGVGVAPTRAVDPTPTLPLSTFAPDPTPAGTGTSGGGTWADPPWGCLHWTGVSCDDPAPSPTPTPALTRTAPPSDPACPLHEVDAVGTYTFTDSTYDGYSNVTSATTAGGCISWAVHAGWAYSLSVDSSGPGGQQYDSWVIWNTASGARVRQSTGGYVSQPHNLYSKGTGLDENGGLVIAGDVMRLLFANGSGGDTYAVTVTLSGTGATFLPTVTAGPTGAPGCAHWAGGACWDPVSPGGSSGGGTWGVNGPISGCEKPGLMWYAPPDAVPTFPGLTLDMGLYAQWIAAVGGNLFGTLGNGLRAIFNTGVDLIVPCPATVGAAWQGFLTRFSQSGPVTFVAASINSVRAALGPGGDVPFQSFQVMGSTITLPLMSVANAAHPIRPYLVPLVWFMFALRAASMISVAMKGPAVKDAGGKS